MSKDKPDKKSISERLDDLIRKRIPSPDNKGGEGIEKGRIDESESLSNDRSDSGTKRMPDFTNETDSDISDTNKSNDE